MRWIALLLAGSAWAADMPPAQFFPPGTKVVIGVELRRVLDSPLGKGLSADAIGASAAAKGQFGGIDFLKDVDSILLATSGAGQNPPLLMVLKGRFHELAGAKYRGVAVQTAPQHADQLLAVVDKSTALAGDLTLVHAALDQYAAATHPPSVFAARVDELSSRYDFWGIGDHLPKSGQAGQMDSVDGFSFGAALRQGLDATAEVHLRTAADAAKMSTSIKMLQAMLQAQSGPTKFQLEAKGSTLKLALNIPEEELKKGIEAQKTAIAAAVMGQMSGGQMSMGPMSLSKPKPKAEPTPGSIVTDARGDTLRVTLPGGR